ncbi:MAG: EF-hand domain-containing protein, partial [Pikeienuella sp.]
RCRLAAEKDSDIYKFLTKIGKQIERKQHSELLRQLLNNFYQTAPSGSLTNELIEQVRAKHHAQRRARKIGMMLGYDLNGDGSISQAEKNAFQGQPAVDLDLLFALADADNDEVISFAEINAYADSKSELTNSNSVLNQMMLFDVDQDGTVTATEIVATVDVLTKEPLALFNVQPGQSKSQVADAVECTAPRPAEDAEVLVLTGYEGAALSTVSITGLDTTTTVAQLIIEPGDKPIYLFLSSRTPVLWEVSGDVKRLTKVVVQKNHRRAKPGAGIVGVSKDRVHFVDAENCISPVSSVEGGKGMLAYREISNNLGREPDSMLAFYTIGSVSLPSGTGSEGRGPGFDTLVLNGLEYAITPEGLKLPRPSGLEKPTLRPPGITQTLRSLSRFHPRGVQAIDAKAVVAPSPAAAYEILPQEAGLLQLLVDGKLGYTSDGYFVIREPISRFPAGLTGAHSVKFLLAKGVPMPGGRPGHSSVTSLETGQCLVSRCR